MNTVDDEIEFCSTKRSRRSPLRFATALSAVEYKGNDMNQINQMLRQDEMIAIMALLLVVLIYFVPAIWVLSSGRSHGGAKFGWFIVAVFFSWLGLAIFLIVTQPVKRKLPGRNDSLKIFDKEF